MYEKKSTLIFPVIALLINAIIIALFVAYAFGLKRDAFDVSIKNIDRNFLITENSLKNVIRDYDRRLDKIIESYPFSSFLQRVVVDGLNKEEQEKIINIFKSGNFTFDTVTLYLADGSTVFSSPERSRSINVNNINQKSLAYFTKDYEGLYFVKTIENEKGIRIGYIVASVFKRIFENTFYNLNFVVLPNGVIFYNPSIDINSIARDRLALALDESKSSSASIEIDGSSYILYSSDISGIHNLSIGILDLDTPISQKYLKYILLSILSISFIFLLCAFFIERNKLIHETEEYIDEPEEEDYNISSISSADDTIDDDIGLLNYDEIELDEMFNSGSISARDLSTIKEAVSDNNQTTHTEEDDVVPTLDDVLADEEEKLIIDEDLDFSDIDDSLSEEKEEEAEVPTLDSILDNYDEILASDDDDLKLDNNLDEALEKVDSVLNDVVDDDSKDIEEGTEEEKININDLDVVLDEDSITDDEELQEEDDNVIEDDNTENEEKIVLEDLDNIIDSMEEDTKESLDTQEKPEDDVLEEVLDDNNVLEEETNDDIINNNVEEEDNIPEGDDIVISHGSIIEDELNKKEEDYFSSPDAFNIAINNDFLDTDDNVLPEGYDEEEVVKKANENDTFDTSDLVDDELYNPEEMPSNISDTERKVRDGLTATWRGVLNSIRGKKFIDKNMNDMLEFINGNTSFDMDHSALLELNENNNIYELKEANNLSDETKSKLQIDANEPLFKKILSHNKTLYISDPFSSDSIKAKFDHNDISNISHMIVIPINTEDNKLKSFFIGFSSNK